MVYSQGFITPTSLYEPVAVEGLIADSFPHDFVMPSPINAAGGVAQVVTLTVGTPANNTTYTVAINKDGDRIGQVSYLSDADATAAEIQTGLINALNGNGLIYGGAIATASGGNVLITSRDRGTRGAIEVVTSGGGTGFAASVTTAAGNAVAIPFGRLVVIASTDNPRIAKLPSAATDVIRGVTVRTHAHEITLTGVDGYKPNEVMGTLNRGRIWVRPTTAFKPSDAVLFIHSGADAGRVRVGAAAGAAALAGAKFETAGNAGELGILAVSF